VVTPSDDLYVDSSGNAHPSHQTNSETYQYSNSDGACWNETLRAAAGVLTSKHGGSCSR